MTYNLSANVYFYKIILLYLIKVQQIVQIFIDQMFINLEKLRFLNWLIEISRAVLLTKTSKKFFCNFKSKNLYEDNIKMMTGNLLSSSVESL